MTPVTSIARRALENLGGPRIVLAAIPGGIRALSREAGVSQGRVSQVLRQHPLPRSWANLIAELIGCSEWEVYEQLGQKPVGSPLGPLFDELSSPDVQSAPAIESPENT
jgi:hypothetical protein